MILRSIVLSANGPDLVAAHTRADLFFANTGNLFGLFTAQLFIKQFHNGLLGIAQVRFAVTTLPLLFDPGRYVDNST